MPEMDRMNEDGESEEERIENMGGIGKNEAVQLARGERSEKGDGGWGGAPMTRGPVELIRGE